MPTWFWVPLFFILLAILVMQLRRAAVVRRREEREAGLKSNADSLGITVPELLSRTHTQEPIQ